MIEPHILIAMVYYSTIGIFAAAMLVILLMFWHLICYNLKKCDLIPSRNFIKISIIPITCAAIFFGIQDYAERQIFHDTINALSDDNVVVKVNGKSSSDKLRKEIIQAFEARFHNKIKGSHPVNEIDIQISLNGYDIFYIFGLDSRNEKCYWVTAYSGNIRSQLGYIQLSTTLE